MRNDVKLGFAIGGVLLAVLIVYVLVVPGGTSGAKKVGQTTQPTGNGTQLASNTGSSHRTGSSSDAGKVTLQPVTSGGTAAPAVPPPTTPVVPPPSYTPPTASATPASTTPKVDPFATKSDAPETTTVAKASAPKNDDWNAILNQPPMLMTTETPSASGAASSSSSARGNHSSAAATPSSSSDSTGFSALPQSSSTPPISSEPAPSAFSSIGSGSSSATSQPSLTGSRTHRIAQGETFASISSAAYGSSKYYPQIMKANPGVDPAHLKVGMTINLPDIGTSGVRPTASPSASSSASDTGEAQHASAPVSAAAPIDANKQYRVQSGDSLYKISLKLYGKSDRANKIFELNKQTMGDDPHHLKVGQVLELPEPPTQSQSQTSTASR